MGSQVAGPGIQSSPPTQEAWAAARIGSRGRGAGLRLRFLGRQGGCSCERAGAHSRPLDPCPPDGKGGGGRRGTRRGKVWRPGPSTLKVEGMEMAASRRRGLLGCWVTEDTLPSESSCILMGTLVPTTTQGAVLRPLTQKQDLFGEPWRAMNSFWGAERGWGCRG